MTISSGSIAHEAARARAALLHATVAAPGEADLAAVAERAARVVAEAEPAGEREAWAERFAAWMRDASFLPNVPTLANAGRGGQLAACFVLEPEDSLDSIYATLAQAARIQQGSGGVGVHFSKLRPRGARIERTGGVSPGPEAFVGLFAHSARINSLAGRRSGAHLAVLRDDHPDVVDFVRSAHTPTEATPGLGRAVGVTDALLAEARDGRDHVLRDPRGGDAGRIRAAELLDEIARSILATGDPTVLFLDRIAADNPTPQLGRIEATNPCGEQPLLPGESCVLGSLQLPVFADASGRLDTERLRACVADAVRFLDDVVDVSQPPDASIDAATRRTRKLGLGVMGYADWLLRRGVRYGSAESARLAGEVMQLVADAARRASEELAAARGAFPAASGGGPGPVRRNASLLAVAPTGTLRLLAGCNGGLEPWLQPVVQVRTAEARLRWTDVWLAEWLEAESSDPAATLAALEAGRGSARLPGVPAGRGALLAPAWEVAPEEQLAVQAAFQEHVDGAVSKTVHLSGDPAPESIADWIQLARQLGCKGVAFYRRGSSRGRADESESPDRPIVDLSAHLCVNCSR